MRYFVSYDLNGKTPTHAEMDKHIRTKYPQSQRVLETVWFLCTNENREQVYAHLNSKLSTNDRVLVIIASGGHWRNILGGDQTLLTNWNSCSD